MQNTLVQFNELIAREAQARKLANQLRFDYLHEQNIKRATTILQDRVKAMDYVHEIVDKKLLLCNTANRNKNNAQNFVATVQTTFSDSFLLRYI